MSNYDLSCVLIGWLLRMAYEAVRNHFRNGRSCDAS